MDTYDIMIRNAMKNGMSQEEIAKKFTDALNSVAKEMDVNSQREKLLVDIEDTLLDHFDEEHFDAEDIGRMAALVYAQEYKDWTVDDIRTYVNGINYTARASARMISAKDADEAIDIAAEEIGNAIVDALSKSKVNKPLVNTDTDTKAQDIVDITEFLKMFS